MVARSETFSGQLGDLRAFCAVVDLGTVTRAAEAIRETKGSVSRRISRLEATLGATLLARTSRAVSPTAEGLAFHARAQESLTILDEALETARDARTVPRGHLRVTTSIDFGVEVMPDLVAGFRILYPQITIELIVTDARLDLAANRIDLALRLGPDVPDSGYRALLLAVPTIGLYAAPDYLVRKPAPIEIAGLIEHDIILPRERPGSAQLSLTDPEGREASITMHPAIRATDFATVLRLTTAGAGIGFVPGLVAARSVLSGGLIRVLPHWQTRGGALSAISLAGRELPARVRLFREHVRTELAARLDALEGGPRA